MRKLWEFSRERSYAAFLEGSCGRGSRVVWVSDRGLLCHGKKKLQKIYRHMLNRDIVGRAVNEAITWRMRGMFFKNVRPKYGNDDLQRVDL
ncbi:hypothetical protein TNCV_2859481 [Trichonephila clavipes]|nr:hypothetical protein TNCV_2859481 [Trichonephila clavipes]